VSPLAVSGDFSESKPPVKGGREGGREEKKTYLERQATLSVGHGGISSVVKQETDDSFFACGWEGGR